MRDRLTILAVLIPLVGLLALVGQAEMARVGPSWRLPIAGYDPRDLLHGHFLRYRFALAWDGASTCGAADALDDACCLCLTRSNPHGIDPPVRQVACSEVERCDGWLRSSHLQPPLRFFIPEEHAKALEDALRERDASVAVTSSRDGTPAIGELFLDGLPWREVLATRPTTTPVSP